MIESHATEYSANFSMTFANGWRVSIQHGGFLNYRKTTVSQGETITSGGTVEVAVFTPEKEFYRLPGWDDDVYRVDADELSKVIAHVVVKENGS